MTFRTLVSIVVLICCLIPAVVAQTSIYLGGGPSVYTSAPYGAANLTAGICNADASTCALANFEGRGSVKRMQEMVYSTAAGIRQVVATASFNGGSVDVFLLGQGGANVTGTAVGLAGTAGGGLTFHPAHAPNWGFMFSAKEVYSPVNPGWAPWAGAQIGYTFKNARSLPAAGLRIIGFHRRT